MTKYKLIIKLSSTKVRHKEKPILPLSSTKTNEETKALLGSKAELQDYWDSIALVVMCNLKYKLV